jgi:hypothetical protein
VKIVGGSYLEAVKVPGGQEALPYEVFSGSGLRAAAAVGGSAPLTTAVDAQSHALAETTAAALGVIWQAVERDQPVAFRYFTAVSPPTIDGPAATHAEALAAEDEIILMFGMVESGPRAIVADHLIIDPQRPRDLTGLDLQGASHKRLTIVANARETRALAGGIGDLEEAARKVQVANGADAMVVKDAGRGCLVLTSKSAATPVRIGPSPTRTVWPLGSGDVFAAGFAYATSVGADSVEAARVASNSAAWWCGTMRHRLPEAILAGAAVGEVLPGASHELPIAAVPRRVYLAAPFFTLAERWPVETCRDVLHGLGADVFSPLHDVGPGGDEVARKDLEGLERSDALFALLDGWDPGTVYEIGWAHRHGLPVVAYLRGPGDEATKMLVGTGAELHDDLPSALYRAVWAAEGNPIEGARVSGATEL